jgi:hypothetical protein
MLRVVLAALVVATATAAALAQSTRFKSTDCGAFDENDEKYDEKCEESFLKKHDPEREKEIIQELKKQRDELNKMRSNAGVTSDRKTDPKKNDVDPKKE